MEFLFEYYKVEVFFMRKLKLIIFIAIILSVITGAIAVNNRKDNKTVENININCRIIIKSKHYHYTMSNISSIII